MLEIDGAQGEGGGQILRTSLSLSLLTQTPIRIRDIRRGRAKPGLMRQHLTCVIAAAQVGAAEVRGAQLGSTEIEFRPQALLGGVHEFAIGTAGSVTLVLQTLLPALLGANAPSEVRVEGGTHTLLAPSTDFLLQAFLPVLRRMGAQVDLQVEREGLFPSGGGVVTLKVTPGALQPIDLLERGTLREIHAEVLLASVPEHVAERELAQVRQHFPGLALQLRQRTLRHATGPGNVLSVWAEHAQLSELVTVFGRKGISAERVASQACAELDDYLQSAAVVGEHLADQLLIPYWLARGGSFRTGVPSLHTRTNIEVLKHFGGPSFGLAETTPGAWLLSCQG